MGVKITYTSKYFLIQFHINIHLIYQLMLIIESCVHS